MMEFSCHLEIADDKLGKRLGDTIGMIIQESPGVTGRGHFLTVQCVVPQMVQIHPRLFFLYYWSMSIANLKKNVDL